MYNTLTGIEVSATQEDIKYYFDLLDAKKDGEIDIDEYTETMENDENLFKWFQFVNKEINDKINPPNVDSKKSDKMSYKEKIEDIEMEIRSCLDILDTNWKESKPSVRIRAMSHSNININRSRFNSNFSAFSEALFSAGSSSETEDVNVGKLKAPKILLSDFSDEELEEKPKTEILKEKLIDLLSKIKVYKQTNEVDRSTDNSFHTSGEKRNLHKKDSAIH